MKIKTILFLFLSSFTVFAANPVLTQFLEDWSCTYKPIHEVCTGGSCGQSTSTHPKWTTIISTYHEADNGVVTRYRSTYTDLGPVYHHICTVTDNLTVSNNVTWGSSVTYCNGTGFSTNALYTLDVGEDWQRGSLSTTTTNFDYNNVNTRQDDCKISLKYTGGSAGFVYTYRLYFQVWEIIRDAGGNMVDNGLVSYSQISMPGKTVYDGSAHAAGDAYVILTISGNPGKVNITPSCSKSFYGISGFEPVLVSVVEK
jgi:hypothetical protein